MKSATTLQHHPLPLVITTGEPAGIGPQISLAAAHVWQTEYSNAPLILSGDIHHLRQIAARFAIEVELIENNAVDIGEKLSAKTLRVEHCPLHSPVRLGELNPDNARYVLDTLDSALNGIRAEHFSAMITAPVHKGIINDAGITFSGHTEYLAAFAQVDKVVMMLADGRAGLENTHPLRVALATTHLPLSAVPSAIDRNNLTRTIDILHHDLRTHFGIEHPCILVTGLNPHAGEGGHMGREEIEVITPTIEAAQARGLDVRGPYPADTLFQPHYLNHADAVLAMYHDQGLPVLKYATFGHGINVTLGLPFIRTSVDHGTALDRAVDGKVDIGSMIAAIRTANDMAMHRAALVGGA